MQSSVESRLVGWKRIAAHLSCSERTARRWETEENLPVHRQQHASKSTVYARPGELDAWLASRAELPPATSAPSGFSGYKTGLLVGALIAIGFFSIWGFRALYSDRPEDSVGSRNPVAVDLYERGRTLWLERGEGPNKRAIKLLEEAVALDEDYAEAWQALASAWMTLPTYSNDVDPNQTFAEALYAADRALNLNDNLVEANSVMAGVAKMRGDWIEARRIYDEAIAKAPDNTMLMLWRAEVYRDLGFIKENRAQLEAGLARDPNSPPIQIALAMNQHITDDFVAGQTTLLYLWNEQGIKTPVSWFGIWHINVRQGEYDAAEAWLDSSPLPIDIGLLSDFLDAMREDSPLVKDAMAARVLTAYSNGFPGWFAYVLLDHLGSVDLAMEVASREADTGLFDLSIVMFDPYFPEPRQTEAFGQIVERLGYLDYWRTHGAPDFCRETPMPAICQEL
ncbi:MAG: tetratricopeptide repeat protein [Pseudomonadota bacterium]